jgi:methylated-DNA-[protein]-cysteine S-methyltransferase
MRLDPEFFERVATEAVDRGLADAWYTRLETPIGRLLVVETSKGVCRVGFAEDSEDEMLADIAQRIGPRVVESGRATAVARDSLEAYFEGERIDLELPVDFALTSRPFALKVLSELRRVRAGEVTTYGRLAERIGHPRAARATGTALARNPIPIIVPCHRVVPGSGGVGKYGGGADRKRWLLELEGALPGA